MSPLRHTMGFIDGDTGNLYFFDDSLKFMWIQAFRGYVEELEFRSIEYTIFSSEPRHNIGFIFFAHRGVYNSNFYPTSLQYIDLVFHQRYKRWYDDSESFKVESRDLIGEWFSSSGRHKHKRIVSLDNAFYDILLTRSKVCKSKVLL